MAASLQNLGRLKDGLEERHPKLIQFGKYLLTHSFPVGTKLELTITTPEGKIVGTNAILTKEDIRDINRCK